ncbi:MAG: hypothetical protein ABWY54_03405 [Glaciihabitans sp.]
MELLFAILIAIVIGFGVSYFTPGRDTYGVLLVPAISGAVTAVVWVALLWLGWTFDGTWIWVVSLVAGPLVSLVVALLLPRTRHAADAALLAELSGGRA